MAALSLCMYNTVWLHFSGFEKPATGPGHVCSYTTVQLHCTVTFILDGGAVIVRDATWKINGTTINQSIPNYVMLKNSNRPSQIVGLQINHALPHDNGTVYTCTDNLAPDNFTSFAILNITGKEIDALNMCAYV